jgi:hypothetical protein
LKSDKSQKEFVKDLVSEATGTRFEIIQQSGEYPFPIKNLEWFVRCRNREDIERTPYLNAVWKERNGPIWLESLALGDTLEWIGSAYGDEAATESLDLNYSDFTDEKFREGFDAKYPLVNQRVQSFELIAEQISKQHKVQLELRSAGSKGIVVFTFTVRISPDGSASLEKNVRAGIAALKDAFQQTKQA